MEIEGDRGLRRRSVILGAAVRGLGAARRRPNRTGDEIMLDEVERITI
jgi:hypothetical protein